MKSDHLASLRHLGAPKSAFRPGKSKPLLKDVVSIDFETANTERAACSLGIVKVEDDEVVYSKHLLINPETYFQPETIYVHGIQPGDVLGAPTWPTVLEEVSSLFTPSTLVIAHNAKFDLDVVKKNCARYEVPTPSLSFACSLKLSEAFFPTIPSCNLKNVCRELSIPLNHHNSLSDATAALEVFKHINGKLRSHGKTLEEYMQQRSMALGRLENGELQHFSSKAAKAYRLPYPSEDQLMAFSGKAFVFAGEFTYWNKRQCEQLVIERDGMVKTRMSNLVDYFVVGSPGFFTSPEDFSERIEKARALSSNGRMKVLTEAEWVLMMKKVLSQ